MYNLIDMTNGAFEVIATGLSFVDATNEAMFLEAYENGRFRAVRASIESNEAWNVWQNEAAEGHFWPEWLD